MKRFAILTGAAGALLTVILGTACGPPVEDVRAPACSDPRPESLMLVAQSVPTASRIPCIVSYPAGWRLGAVDVRRGQSSFRLNAGVNGLRNLQVTLRDECDVAGATPVPTDEPGLDRYDRLPTEGGDRMVRTYAFAGGCVTYDFHFQNVKPAVIDEASMAIGFLTRTEVTSRFYEYAQ